MKRVYILIIFLVIGTGIYFNSLKNEFHYDDIHHIFQNSYIRTLGNIPLFFTEPRTLSIRPTYHLHYRPLIMTSYAINYYIGRFNPAGYHLVNLAFHIGSAFLLFLILQAMLGRSELPSTFIPIVAGLLFLTTPYNTEVVNYVTARSTVMCTFFYLMAFYFWLIYRRADGKNKEGDESHSTFNLQPSTYYIASLLAFLLAMLTKEIAITLPVILWLYDIYFVHRAGNGIRKYKIYLPFVIVGGIVGIVIRMVFFKSFLKGQPIGLLTHFIVEVKAIARYFIHMAIPVKLSVVHLINETPDIYLFLSLLLIISIVILAYILWRTRDHSLRMASFFIAWFFIVLLPTSLVSLVAPYQENRGYPSAIAFVALMAVGLEKVIKKIVPPGDRQALIGYSIVCILIVVFSIGVVQRNRVWFSEERLWSDVLKKYPESTNARLSLGNYYRVIGETDRALAEYESIADIDPHDPDGYANMGAFYLKNGDMDKAEEFFKKALDIHPFSDVPNFHMSTILQARGDLSGAAKHLLMTLVIRTDDLDVSARLVELYQRMGKLDEAYDRLRGAIREDPNNPAIMRALGLIYMIQGKWKEAGEEYETVLKYIPDNPATLLDLGLVYNEQGLKDLAELKFQQALRSGSGDLRVYQGLGIFYQKQKRYKEALVMYGRVLEKNPKSSKVLNNMGLIYFEEGEYEKAISALKMALEIEPSYHIARFNLGNLYETQGKKDLAKKEYKRVIKDTSPEGGDKGIYLKAKEKLASLS